MKGLGGNIVEHWLQQVLQFVVAAWQDGLVV